MIGFLDVAARHFSLMVTTKGRSSVARPDPSASLRAGSRGRLSPHGFLSSNPTIGLVAVGLILLAMSGCYSGSRPARIGSAAPDFTVRDAGRAVTLSQFKGQVVVLNFWATWCPPCIEEMPSLVQMQERMKAKGVTVLAVSVDVDQSNYQRFLRDHNVDLLSVRDADQKSNALYGTFKFPETYIIDRNGVVRRKFIGAVDWTEPDVIEYLSKLSDKSLRG
ncbi:MAG: TlpA disulfide reductase family protein [Candidatus Sulfotelmatobacter sp.]